MQQIKGNYLLLNGKAEEAGTRIPVSSAPFYEVLRVVKGIPLFLEDHLSRLYNSVSVAGIKLPEEKTMKKELEQLINLNEVKEGNIRINVFSDNAGKIFRVAFFIPHTYPDPSLYLTGVNVKTFKHSRPNPSVKKWDDSFRRQVSDFISRENLFEAILTDDHQCLTEGSRSNLFFADNDGHIISAPESTILNGITRIKVLKLCSREGIIIDSKPIPVATIGSYPGCFLTGTSPMVIPVRTIDNITYDPSLSVIRRLIDLYLHEIQAYLLSYQPE